MSRPPEVLPAPVAAPPTGATVGRPVVGSRTRVVFFPCGEVKSKSVVTVTEQNSIGSEDAGRASGPRPRQCASVVVLEEPFSDHHATFVPPQLPG